MSVLMVVVGIVAIGLMFVVLPTAAQAYFRWRGPRLVTCPENKEAAAVEVDAAAAAIGELAGQARVRLQDCSRWPERHDCGQECLNELRTAPDENLLRNLVRRWCDRRVCALCHKPIDTSLFSLSWIGLRMPDGSLRRWPELPAEQLPEMFACLDPVCWDCLIEEKFRERKLHPDRGAEELAHKSGNPWLH